jgi:hypothetical protein
MILYNQDTETKDCDFKVDSNTEKFLISFFGFYPHGMSEDYNVFLKELGIKKLINIYEDEINSNDFEFNGTDSFKAYDVCDRRTFDLALILTKVFNSKVEAIEWFNKKVKDSEYIKKSEINEVEIVDAEKFMVFVKKELEYEYKIETIEKEFNKNMIEMKIKMIKDFSFDKDYSQIIENKFEKFKKLKINSFESYT